jgi:cysteine-rich repeat protein
MTRSKNGLKWLGPVLSVAVACALFASCTAEERDFDTARNQGNGNSDAGADAASDAGGDAGNFVGNECVGLSDGTGCGSMSGFICVNESCSESSCRDGYVDDALDEECDDGNTDSNDGCELDCTFTCEADADCDDGNPCNGEESCDTGDHVCLAGDAPDTTEQVPCTLPLPPAMDAGAPVDSGTDSGLLSDASGPVLTDASGVDGSADGSASDGGDAGEPVDPTVGFCKAGLCVPQGCGNGILQAGEECDDFDLDDTDGCKADCTYTCESDIECDDQSVCTGTETCNTSDHTCVAGDSLDCTPADDCHDDDCDPTLGCLNSLIDEDGDGHAPDTLDCGDDCDDDDATSYTGAGDLCGDGIDNDCNGTADDVVPTWFVDCDEDGYAANTDFSEQQCNAPAPFSAPSCTGWTTRVPIMSDLTTVDCMDTNASVFPNRDPDPFSPTAVPGKASLPYDWNCNGVQEKEPVNTGANPSGTCNFDNCNIVIGPAAAQSSIPGTSSQIYFLCCGSTGYTAGFQPSCGNQGEYTYCSGCTRTTIQRAQACH